MAAEEAQSDDREAFMAAFAREHDRIFAYIYSLVGHRADAEDVFQRTSMILWKKYDQFDPEAGSFLSWACGVAFYEVRNFIRVSGRDRHYFDQDLLQTLAEQRAATVDRRDERLAALRNCIRQLGADDRELLTRAYESGKSLTDWAAQTGRAVQTLYNRLSGIRRQLLSCIDRTLAGRKGTQA